MGVEACSAVNAHPCGEIHFICFINISSRDHSGWWIGRNDNIVWFDVLRVLILGPSSVDGWPSSR